MNFKCMKLLFLTLVFFICFTAIGQNSTTSSVNSNYVITGKVYDSTIKQYLEGASILCRNKYGTSSGYDGKFRLKLPEKYSKKNFSIHVFSLGYNSAKIKIKNKKSALQKDLLVYLKQMPIDMNQVIVIQ